MMEKQKNQPQYLSSQTIVILWAMIQAFGWAMIFVLITQIDPRSFEWIIFGFIGLLSGGLMGALQHTLIERGTGVQLKNWLILTAVGTSIGLLLMSNDRFWDESPYLFVLPIFLVPALCQWFSLRKYTRAGLLWIVANVISNMVFVMFLLIIQDYNEYFLSAVIPAVLQGIASGFVMVWLLRQLPNEEIAQEKAKVSYDDKVKVA